MKLDTKDVSEKYELLQTLNKNTTDSSLMSFSRDNNMKSDGVDLKSESILKSFNGGMDKYSEIKGSFVAISNAWMSHLTGKGRVLPSDH